MEERERERERKREIDYLRENNCGRERIRERQR